MAYYNVLFDHGVDQAYNQMGFGPDYAATRKLTTYSADFRVRYLRELHVGAKVRVGFQLLDSDGRKFHFCQWLFHEDGWLSATGEGIGLHIDMSGPRVTAYPPDIKVKVDAMLEAHKSCPVPDFVGMPMTIRKG
jgi:acyl-CoA thioester hydrolase